MDDLIGGMCEVVGEGIGKCAGLVGDVIDGTVVLITSMVGDGQTKSQPQVNQVANSKGPKLAELDGGSVREAERQRTAIHQWINNPDRGFAVPCGCLGPRDSQPACPCAMKERYVEVDGYYYEIHRDVVNNEVVLKATNRGQVKGEAK